MSKRNVVHIEIPAADQEVAGKFYQSLFGWKINPIPDMNYTMWEAGEGPGGGFPSIKDMPQVTVYFDSPDIEADLKNVEKLGGTVVQPKTEIPGMGWFAVFKDPTGNVLALFTDKPHDH